MPDAQRHVVYCVGGEGTMVAPSVPGLVLVHHMYTVWVMIRSSSPLMVMVSFASMTRLGTCNLGGRNIVFHV